MGSHARGTASDDSDIDLVILTARPSDYTTREDWVDDWGLGHLVDTRSWGAITERRLRHPSGRDIDVGIGEPTWASERPINAGTLRVVRDGLRPLYDPQSLLKQLLSDATPSP